MDEVNDRSLWDQKENSSSSDSLVEACELRHSSVDRHGSMDRHSSLDRHGSLDRCGSLDKENSSSCDSLDDSCNSLEEGKI